MWQLCFRLLWLLLLTECIFLNFYHSGIEGHESKAVMRMSIMYIEVGLFAKTLGTSWRIFDEGQAKEDI